MNIVLRLNRTALIAASTTLVLAALAPRANAQVGFALFRATVLANATVSTSNGVVSAVLATTGTYNVKFTRPINVCSLAATVNGLAAGQATAALKAGTTDTLTVRTFTGAGVLQNRNFDLIVTCGP